MHGKVWNMLQWGLDYTHFAMSLTQDWLAIIANQVAHGGAVVHCTCKWKVQPVLRGRNSMIKLAMGKIVDVKMPCAPWRVVAYHEIGWTQAACLSKHVDKLAESSDEGTN